MRCIRFRHRRRTIPCVAVVVVFAFVVPDFQNWKILDLWLNLQIQASESPRFKIRP
jgi:hypothetical protein